RSSIAAPPAEPCGSSATPESARKGARSARRPRTRTKAHARPGALRPGAADPPARRSPAGAARRSPPPRPARLLQARAADSPPALAALALSCLLPAPTGSPIPSSVPSPARATDSPGSRTRSAAPPPPLQAATATRAAPAPPPRPQRRHGCAQLNLLLANRFRDPLLDHVQPRQRALN